SPPGICSGGGSCTHGGKAYEAHLNLILLAVKLVESVGNAPTSTCLRGRCIPCLPRPHWQVAVVLPQAGLVLYTLPYRMVRDLSIIKWAGSVHSACTLHFNKE